MPVVAAPSIEVSSDDDKAGPMLCCDGVTPLLPLSELRRYSQYQCTYCGGRKVAIMDRQANGSVGND